METNNSLERFISAQKNDYDTALAEIKNGKKRSHWMWYIFPQMEGLGLSSTSIFYGIKDLNEAERFLQHPILGGRLIEISQALLQLKSNDAYQIVGSPDDMKLQSCMTLFAALPNTNPVFVSVLDKFYGGKKDNKTLQLIK
jgi:uncharacterized protein (DUF1810 family)